MSRLGWLVPCFLLSVGCEPTAVVGFSDAPGPVAVYETLEFVFEAPVPVDGDKNPFTMYPTMTFSRAESAGVFHVFGFYDGDGVWRARFMPNQPGIWNYGWEFRGDGGSGELEVGPRQDPERHGHVHVPDGAPGSLVHDDGTSHYWVGGKWFSAKNYGPRQKDGEENVPEDGIGHDAYYSDEQFEDYLDVLTETRHNGVLLKIGGIPLENDRLSWDLDWIKRADRWVSMLNERNVYVQLNFFDPWSRGENSYFDVVTDVEDHLLPAWGSRRAKAKENYIRNVVARFAGYANVYWELVNRIDEPGEDLGNAFVDEAPNYIRSIRSYDPYHLAIGASDVARAREIHADIEFPREAPEAPDPGYARIWNELVDVFSASNGCSTDLHAHEDAAIRDPTNRSCYRAAFWTAFVEGSFGSSEASWLDLNHGPVDDAVRDVMLDHRRLRTTIDNLSVPVDELWFNPGFEDPRQATEAVDCPPDSDEEECPVVTPSGHVGTRSSHGRVYVSYFRGQHGPGTIWVQLPQGTYRYHWLDPAHEGPEFSTYGVMSPGGRVAIDHPAFNEDLVLIVELSRPTSVSPM